MDVEVDEATFSTTRKPVATRPLRRRLVPTMPADRWLVAVIVVGVVIRVVWCLWAVRPHIGVHDPSYYDTYARRLAGGFGYTTEPRPNRTSQPTAYYPFGYPAALSVAYWVTGHTVGDTDMHRAWAAAMFNLVLSAVTLTLVGLFARRLAGRWVAVAATAVIAFFPNLIFHTSVMLTETLFNAVLVAFLTVLLWRPIGERMSTRRAVGAGLLLGGAVMVRPVALMLLGLVAIAFWRRRRNHIRALRTFGLVVVTMLVPIVPWVVRNAVVMDHVALATNTGDNLCIGNHPGANGTFSLPDACFAQFNDIADFHAESARDRKLTAQGLSWAAHHITQEPKLVVLRTFWTFVHDHDGLRAAQSYEEDPWVGATKSSILIAVADGYFFGVLTMGLLGSVLFLRSRNGRLVFLVATAAALTITVWPFFGDARFHIPVVFVLAFPAGAALVKVLERSRPTPPAWTGYR